jgi:hypothetical protein
MGISTGGNINISGAGNVVDLNVTGPAIFNTDIYVGGNIYNANLTSGKDGFYTGNFTVLGNLRYTNVSVVVTDNLQFKLANNQSNAALLDGGGWTLGANNQGTFLYNNASESWQTNLSLLPTANNSLDLGGPINHWNNLYVNNALIPGNLVAGAVSGTFSGDAGNLTNIPAANISGTVATANTVTNNAQPNITSTGTLTSLTVSGNVSAAYLFGSIIGTISNAVYANSAGQASTANTVTSNLQPNINMVGTLTTLSVSGNTQSGNLLTNGYISAQGNATALYFFGNGSQLSGINTALSGNLQGNISANGYYINNLPALSVTGNITGNYFLGNGSQLTGIITSVSNLVNGSSNIDISAADANITMSVSAVANVATVTPTGLSVTGNITATGNISANNLYVGNTLFTRTLTVATNDIVPITVPLASNNSFNVQIIGGANVAVYTT